jgi:hypothetical protein
MLLLMCEQCDDVRRIDARGLTQCRCRASKAYGTPPGKPLCVRGPCTVVGLHDASLRGAITRKRGAGMWWVLPANSQALTRLDRSGKKTGDDR